MVLEDWIALKDLHIFLQLVKQWLNRPQTPDDSDIFGGLEHQPSLTSHLPARQGSGVHISPARPLLEVHTSGYTDNDHPGQKWCQSSFHRHWVLDDDFGNGVDCNACRMKGPHENRTTKNGRYRDSDHPGLLWCTRNRHWVQEAMFGTRDLCEACRNKQNERHRRNRENHPQSPPPPPPPAHLPPPQTPPLYLTIL
ncbi:hypothetical protein K435DRAFT_866807 [Dendrothele bispora CBS 962.96]|uniref:Uncharacterized protein n=1 Tax=Dendrothele bispora (strain CBS 962.96) TaxID=1314807 RepID=A0A4S8LFX9_DENBC|nr:hypothetical protein K435DRAFT_866807 [Dendrothele bispora CBS 962.96]